MGKVSREARAIGVGCLARSGGGALSIPLSYKDKGPDGAERIATLLGQSWLEARRDFVTITPSNRDGERIVGILKSKGIDLKNNDRRLFGLLQDMARGAKKNLGGVRWVSCPPSPHAPPTSPRHPPPHSCIHGRGYRTRDYLQSPSE